MRCAIEGFGASRSRDPAWRDFLLAQLDAPSPQFADVTLLAHLAPDAKVGAVLAHRLATRNDPWEEAEMLPSMMGDKSVAVLMSALDRFQKEEKPGASGAMARIMARSTMIGLMRATNTVLWPDGRQTTLPPGSETGKGGTFSWYFNDAEVDTSAVASQWLAWWTAHEQEFGGGQYE